jgi:group I intron endonuclease
MIIYTIYKAVNQVNGKVYIGFDSNWPNRVKVHKTSSKKQNYKFYRAIRKYGWDNFQWDIIYQSKDKEHTLSVMETYFIEQYNSFNDGYNSTLGGDGTFGHFISEESKKKISQGNKVPKPQTKEHIQKRADSLRGKKKNPLSEEVKLKISIANKGIPKPMSEEHKKALKCHINNSTKVSCPHCNKVGQLTNMKRWHFDNCKSNPKGSGSNDQKV